MTARSESSSPLAEAAPVSAWGAAAVGVLLLTVSFAALHLPLFGELRIIDTPIYQLYGELMGIGMAPYRDFALEYPPAALPAFWLPTLGPVDDYASIFEVLMWACGVAAVTFVVTALAAVRATSRRIYAAAAFVALAPIALGPVVLSRYDLWPAALVAAAVAAFASGRELVGWSALAVAVAAKIYPLVLLPLAFAWTVRRRGWRETWAGVAVFLLALAVIVVPFALLSAGGLADSVHRQLGRPLQVESLGGSILLAAHRLGWYDPTVVSSYGSQNLAGALPDSLALVQTVLQAGAILAVWVLAVRGRPGRERFLLAAAAAVVAFVALGKVVSPQFLIWLVALVPLAGGPAGLRASALLGAALVATQLWFPTRYWDFVGLGPQVWLVLARDILLLAVLGVLLAALSRPTPAPA